MRILFVLSSLPVGGMEILAIDLAKEISKLDNDIGILVFKSEGLESGLIGNLGTAKFFYAGRKRKFNFSFLANISKVIQSFQPSIILSFSDFAYLFTAVAQKISHNTAPHIIAFHSLLPFTFKERIFTSFFLFLSKVWKAKYIFVSHVQRDLYHARFKIDSESSFVIHNGVDKDFFMPSKKHVEDFFTIIHIANIKPEKDQWNLFHSLVILNKSFEKWRLIFIGDDKCNLLEKFKFYLNQKVLLDKVVFLRQIGRAPIKNLLSESDVFVLSSIAEVFPIAALEAMAMGLPCILTNVGGCPELIEDNYNGYLVKPNGPQAMAGRLLYLFKNPELLKQMGLNAQKTIEEKFGLDKCVNSYINLFAKIVEN